ncbi:MAG TPA: 3'(2'),5'-bisphosphate nucleotidase CysQ [Rhizobiales bacterium]|nr:3'(2'),5'-bisphosphate nucleotidase CysQ [Hyphomicrobiales bacterium]
MPAAEAIRAAEIADDLALIREAAQEAGRIAMSFFGRNPEVWLKTGQSPVTAADYAVDRFLRETLTAARPAYGWLSEETADTPDRLSARRTFVVDPIDGTRAFIEGRSTWCVSVAVVESGRPLAGVLDCPARSEIFEASIGGGAFKDGARIGVREAGATPLVAGPKSMFAGATIPWPADFRRGPYFPSLAYRVAAVAAGELDATYVKPNAHDWDIAAADVILSEAGGRIVDARGADLTYAGVDPRHGRLVAGSGRLLDRLSAMLAAIEADHHEPVSNPPDLL